MAAKKIWNCGMARPTRPDATLNTIENTITGAESWMPRAKLEATVRMATVAPSCSATCLAGANSG